MHIAMRRHGGTPAVAVRLAGDLQACDAPIGTRCQVRNPREAGKLVCQGVDDVVQVLPAVQFIPTAGHHDVAHPAPAFLDLISGHEDLKEALGPPFVADECAVRLGKGPGRQDDLSLLSRGMPQVIDDDDMLAGVQEGTHLAGGGTPIQVIFQRTGCEFRTLAYAIVVFGET
jgi:hypothetical protein